LFPGEEEKNLADNLLRQTQHKKVVRSVFFFFREKKGGEKKSGRFELK
jgi:hypothetical protein